MNSNMMRNKKTDAWLTIPGKLYLVTQNSIAFIRRFIHEKKKYSQKIFKGLIHYFFSQISVLLFNKFFHTSKQLSVAKVSSTNHQMSLPWHHDRFLETGQMWGSFSLRLKWWESEDWMCSATDLAVPAPNIGFQVIKVPMFSLIHLFVCVCNCEIHSP